MLPQFLGFACRCYYLSIVAGVPGQRQHSTLTQDALIDALLQPRGKGGRATVLEI